MENHSVDVTTAATEWRSPEAVPEAGRPAALWPWLAEPASLTARLRRNCAGCFGVSVLTSGPAGLTAGEIAWTGHDRGFIREVYLCCGATPWVRARTITVNGGAAEAWLKALGTTPLGDGAFKAPSTRRDCLEVACYDRAARAWGRRSILRIGGESFFISEHFLGGTTPWQ